MRDQDLGDAGHPEELGCQRSAPNSLLYSVLGENLESLQRYHDEELECLRSAPQTRRKNVQGKNLKDVHQYNPSAKWNVNGLLDKLPDDLDQRHDRRRFHKLFHHLRHNVVEQRDQRHRVDDLLRGALQYPFLRQHLKQRCCRPAAPRRPSQSAGHHGA